jgi:hypothetical protein
MHFYATKLLACGFVSLRSILFHNVVTNFDYVTSNIHMTVAKRSRWNFREDKQIVAD